MAKKPKANTSQTNVAGWRPPPSGSVPKTTSGETLCDVTKGETVQICTGIWICFVKISASVS